MTQTEGEHEGSSLPADTGVKKRVLVTQVGQRADTPVAGRPLGDRWPVHFAAAQQDAR